MKTFAEPTRQSPLAPFVPILAFLILLAGATPERASSAMGSFSVERTLTAELSKAAAEKPGDVIPTNEEIIMQWSSPTRAPHHDLVAWHDENAPRLAAVEAAWGGLLRRLSGHRPGRFESQCLALSSSLQDFDRSGLLPVPDPLIDLYVKRLLRHLHAATQACTTHQLFNVVYRLEEARAALTQVRWFLARRGGLDLRTTRE